MGDADPLRLALYPYILTPRTADAATRQWLARERRGPDAEAAVARFETAAVDGLL